MNEKVITLGKVYNECKIFSSIIFILDKLEGDGYFDNIFESLQSIFEREMAFAVLELRKIKLKKKKFDIQNQLINNTFIFKENLKLIVGSLIDSLWNHRIGPENISQTIQFAQSSIHKGNFEEIIEEEEENYVSSEVPSKISIADPVKNVIVKELEYNTQSIYKDGVTYKESEGDFEYSYTTDKDSKDYKFMSGDQIKKLKPENHENEQIKSKIRKNIKANAFIKEKQYYATETLKTNRLKENDNELNLIQNLNQTNSENLNSKMIKEINSSNNVKSNEFSEITKNIVEKKNIIDAKSSSIENESCKFESDNPKDLLSLTVSNISQNCIKTLNNSKKKEDNNTLSGFARSNGLNKYLEKGSQNNIPNEIKRSKEKIPKTHSNSKESNSSLKYSKKLKYDNKSKSHDNSRFKNNVKKSLLRKLSEKKQKETRRAKTVSNIHKSIPLNKKNISKQQKSSLTKLKKLKTSLINSERNANKASPNKYKNREAKSSCISPHVQKNMLNPKSKTKLNLKDSKNKKANWKDKNDQSKSINIQININDLHNKHISSYEQDQHPFNPKDSSHNKKIDQIIPHTSTISSSFSINNTNSSWTMKDSTKPRHYQNNQIFSKKIPIFGIKRSNILIYQVLKINIE